MKILVAEAKGFLGDMFLDVLRKKNIPFIEYDARYPENFLSGFDQVVHFAALTPTSSEEGDLSTERFQRENVENTAVLLQAVKKNKKLKKIVQVGSSAEYGFSSKPIKEGVKEKPVGQYGESMLARTNLFKAFSQETGVKTITLRVFNEAGLPKRAKMNKMLSKRPSLFESLYYQFTSEYTGTVTLSNKNSVRDYVDADDIIDSIVAALETNKGETYELVNIASGKGIKLQDIVTLFSQAFNKKYSLALSESNKSDKSIGDRSKALKVLGWKPKTSLEDSVHKMIGPGKKIIVVGAGEAARKIVEQIKKENRRDILVDGFVDDDEKKQGTRINGARVIGKIKDLARIIKERGIEQVLISTPSVGGDFIKRVTESVPAGISITVLPSISSVILGKVDLSVIRNIEPADLIGRPLVKADQQFISKKSHGKRFLVTGGAGSIGSEIVRQIFDSEAAELVVIDAWEEGIFNLHEEFNARRNDPGRPKLKTYVANIRDRVRLEDIMSHHKIDVIIHAAAYKHLPLMEEHPYESEQTNKEGTRNMLDMAIKFNVKDFVLISTDKAVNPISVMGKSKRDAELLVKEYATKYPDRRFCAVRFGNVLNSSGSIVPKFIKQIKSRSPITITHMGMTRYFMAIPEAVSLVLLSWIVSKNGQILILDMGEPIKIIDLAMNLIKFHGLEPYKDIEIREIGIRAGEKIHEELAYNKSMLRKSPAKRVYIAEEL